MSEIAESIQPDHEKMAEIQALLMESDAGQVKYDKEGNPLYSDEQAETAHKVAKEQDAAAQGDILEETPAEPEPQEIEGKQEQDDTPKTVNYDDDIEVPMPDGRETLKIGELKDRYVEQARTREALETAQAELATERLIVNEVLRAGGEVSEERIAQLQQLNQQQLERDNATILQMYPQWQNAETRERDVGRILETGLELGATETELRATSKPWIIRMMKELADYRMREQRGKKVVKPVPMKEPTAKKAAPDAPKGSSRAAQLARLLSEPKDREQVDWHGLDQLLRNK